MKGDRERCLAVGMTDYLSKPLKSETVADMVERVLRVTSGVTA
jgi:CheY-like chemotaxis protein